MVDKLRRKERLYVAVLGLNGLLENSEVHMLAKKARLNCINHLLSQIPYDEINRDLVTLPERVRNPDYHRLDLPTRLYVPEVY